jgi:hypothetical protein
LLKHGRKVGFEVLTAVRTKMAVFYGRKVLVAIKI